MNFDNKLNNRYNVFIISRDVGLLESFESIEDRSISLIHKKLFDVQEVFIGVERSILDALIFDLDSFGNEALNNIIINIKNTPKLQQLPLVVLSSDSDIDKRIQILNQGVDDFIEKPVILDEFLARIHNILRRCQKFTNEKIIAVDDIKINILNRKVEIKGKQIKISAKEFGILQLLAENFNKIFSRKDILNTVWNHSSVDNVNERTVDVHINRLRIALGKNANGDSYIRTVRGEGYSIHIEAYEKNHSQFLNKNYYYADRLSFGFQDYLNKNAYSSDSEACLVRLTEEYDFTS